MATANAETLVKRYEGLRFKIKYPVLDVGGSQGSFLEYQGVKDATILDLNIPEEPKFNHKYVKADISKKLPDLKTKFGTIFITEVLEHIKNPLYLLAQVYDLLSEDGICFISIPYTEIGENHHHVCRWKKKEILDQTRKLGFIPKIVQERRRFKGFGFFLPHCWLVLALKKRFDNNGGDGHKWLNSSQNP